MRKDLSHLKGYMLDDGIDGARYVVPMYGINFRIIASWGEGWDHISVSTQHRIPTWEEMCKIKALFFEPEEVVMQLHPAEANYINFHPHCLHLWRPQNEAIPTPPLEFV